jgi:hypothetical protein
MAACKVSCLLQQSQTPGAGCICGADRPANRVSVFTSEDRELLASISDSQVVLVTTIRDFMSAQMGIARAVVKLTEAVAALSLASPKE